VQVIAAVETRRDASRVGRISGDRVEVGQAVRDAVSEWIRHGPFSGVPSNGMMVAPTTRRPPGVRARGAICASQAIAQAVSQSLFRCWPSIQAGPAVGTTSAAAAALIRTSIKKGSLDAGVADVKSGYRPRSHASVTYGADRDRVRR
jgi:hypothetical protein